jgi:hypothetical protein
VSNLILREMSYEELCTQQRGDKELLERLRVNPDKRDLCARLEAELVEIDRLLPQAEQSQLLTQ